LVLKALKWALLIFDVFLRTIRDTYELITVLKPGRFLGKYCSLEFR
jgi:hypothetical protein